MKKNEMSSVGRQFGVESQMPRRMPLLRFLEASTGKDDGAGEALLIELGDKEDVEEIDGAVR